MHPFLKPSGLFILLIFISGLFASAQGKLKPGFDPEEYAILLNLNPDPAKIKHNVPGISSYRHVYRSEPSELDNYWDLYISKGRPAIIEIHGTTAKTKSWLENFYSAMVPAEGSIVIRKNEKFNYKLAEHPDATVHTGWLTGLASMSSGIVEKINEFYKKGEKEFILMGHSQGGAITFMLNSYLHYDIHNEIPDDIVFKTYNSAAPKPGNLYYSYDYSYINRGGWAFRVVNTLDWVPETPISVQRMEDFNEINPFTNFDTFTGSMGWVQRAVMKSVFNKTNRSLKKAQKRLLKYLGFKVYGFLEDYMPDMVEPEYIQSMNYAPAGDAIILPPTEKYYSEFVANAKQNVFLHHYGPAYYFLLKEHYLR